MMIKLVSLVTTAGLLTVMCALVDCECSFQDEVYQTGDIWNPGQFGTCVNCTCQSNGQVSCINAADNCPKLTCATPKKNPNSCCPYCEVSADEDESSSNSRKECTSKSGKSFKDGDYFASNNTGIRPTKDNQCVMCICQDGQSLCFLKTCPVRTSCSAFIETDDDCCPVCVDCADTSGVKKNGSSWHPTIASIGEITCFTCTCLNGEITCQKNCIPDHELPCRHPHTPNGECCRTCPSASAPDSTKDKTADKKTPKTSKERKDRKGKKRRKKDRKGKKGRKGKGNKGDKKRRRRKCDDAETDSAAARRCNRRHRRRKEKKTTRLTVRPTPSAGVDLSTLCIRQKRSTYLVYKAITKSEMMIGFDDIQADTVTVYKWSVTKENERDAVTYMEPETLPATEFRKTINNTNVVGTTGSSQYRKFKQRLKDKLERCATNCEPQVFIKILQRVKVRLLKFGDKC